MVRPIQCKKLVLVGCGEKKPKGHGPGILTDRGVRQATMAGQRLRPVLKKDKVSLTVLGYGKHLVQSADYIRNALDGAEFFKPEGGISLDMRYPQSLELCMAPHTTALVCICEYLDLTTFHGEAQNAGFRNLSHALSPYELENDVQIFGNGSFWCADLEKRTLFCGRARCRPPKRY